MRSVRLTLWHMGLVIALVVGTATAIGTGLQTVFPEWRFPWFVPFCALVALDAVTTQRIVARERLSLAEQGPLRVVELMLLVIIVRVASLAAEDVSFSELARTWLLDPLAVFGGEFAIYLLIGVMIWISATRFTHAVLQFETELPREGVRSLESEEAAVVEERVQAVAQFDRQWFMCLLLALAGTAVALYGVPLGETLQRWAVLQPLIAMLCVLVSGLLLHTQGHFDRLMYGWRLGQVVVAPDVRGRWYRSTWLLSLVALLIGVVLGTTALLIPPPPLVPILNALLLVGTLLLAIVIGLFSLLLLPLAWLLSRLTGQAAPPPPALPQIQPYQIPQTVSERPILPALIFWGCMLLLVGIAALRYVQQRQELRNLVGRWRGLRWLLRFLDSLWADARAWSTHAVRMVQQRLHRRRRPPLARRVRLTGMQGQLRALYQRLIQAAVQQGLPHPPSQTPYEFEAAVREGLPAAAADVAALTEVYVAAEYGPAVPEPPEIHRARRAWRRALRTLSRKRGQEQGQKVVRTKGPRERNS